MSHYIVWTTPKKHYTIIYLFLMDSYIRYHVIKKQHDYLTVRLLLWARQHANDELMLWLHRGMTVFGYHWWAFWSVISWPIDNNLIYCTQFPLLFLLYYLYTFIAYSKITSSLLLLYDCEFITGFDGSLHYSRNNSVKCSSGVYSNGRLQLMGILDIIQLS